MSDKYQSKCAFRIRGLAGVIEKMLIYCLELPYAVMVDTVLQ